jgi:hypothetical protein
MKTNRSNPKLFLFFLFGSAILLIGIFILYQVRRYNEKKFITAFYDQENNTIWELRYNNPKKIYINIIDPQSNKQIKQIKNKKDTDLDHNISFQLFKQDDKIVLIGYGETPVFDVYDAVSYQKISDIHDFEKISPLSEIGIAKLNNSGYKYSYLDNKIIEIFSPSFEKYHYDIRENKLFNSEYELLTFIGEKDNETAPPQKTAFTLFRASENGGVQLYKITSRNKSNFTYLSRIDNSRDRSLEGFNQDKWRDCDKCVATRLTERIFRYTGIAYHDTSLVVMVSGESDEDFDKQSITAFNNKGDQLFEINQNDYPNSEMRKKNKTITPAISGYHHKADKNQLVIFFGKYGAINIEYPSAKIIWKYEPEVKYEEPKSGRRR